MKADVKPDLEIIQSFTQPTFRIINLRPNITYRIVISANNTYGRSRPHELVARTKGKVVYFGCFEILSFRYASVQNHFVYLYIFYVKSLRSGCDNVKL